MTILITGAFGFVGTNLSAYLAERGHELWALDVEGANSKVLKCESSKVERDSGHDAETQRGGGANAQRSTLNVQRSGSGRGAYVRCFGWEELASIPWVEVDAVIHLAGKAHDTRNASDPQSYFDVNVGLTKRVLDVWRDGEETTKDTKGTEGDAVVVACKDAKTQRKFILFSSVKAVADRVEGVLTEEALPDPKTPYGKSKLEAEGEVLKCGSSQVRELGTTANSTNRANESDFRTSELQNFRTYILRPCMIHGPGNKGNLNLLYGVVKGGLPWPLGAFENRRSFASIGNVCAVVDGLLAGNVPAGVYQVADDEALSTNALIGLIAETLGRRARIWKISCGWVRAFAKAGDILHLPLNSERLKKLTESYVASNAKIKKALGWERMPVSARAGMRQTIMSFETTKGIKNTEG